MTGPAWSAAGFSVRPVLEHHPQLGVVVHAPHRGGVVLPPELLRSLRDWVTWWLADDGDTPEPAGPDAVRLAVDEQRAALSARSVEACSEDFRAGLAWADNALDAIAKAAGEAS